MKQDQSFDSTPKATAASIRHARGRTWLALVAAATLVSACTGGGSGSPSAPAASPGGASPSAAGSPAGSPAASVALWQPEQPINMVVPFAAGGPTDTVTRLVADPMGATLGQQIVVQNVAGAGGTLAAGQVADRCPGRLHGAHAPHRDVDGALALRGSGI